jgi:hypothetical protein
MSVLQGYILPSHPQCSVIGTIVNLPVNVAFKRSYTIGVGLSLKWGTCADRKLPYASVALTL